MLFNYFKDKIILNNELIDNDLDIPLLDSFIKKTKESLVEMGFVKQSISFFYKRNKNGASVIGIQVEDGDSEDISNYVIYDAALIRGEYCMDFHAKPKIIDKALMFNELLAKNVYKFLSEMEKELLNSSGKEFDIMKKIQFQKKSKLLQIFKKD